MWRREWKGARANKSGKDSDCVEADSGRNIVLCAEMNKTGAYRRNPIAVGWRWGKNWAGRSFHRLLSSLKVEVKRGLNQDSGTGNEENERKPKIRESGIGNLWNEKQPTPACSLRFCFQGLGHGWCYSGEKELRMRNWREWAG